MEMHFVPEQTAGAIIEILRYWVMEYHVDGFKLLGAGLDVYKRQQLDGRWILRYRQSEL